MGGSRRRLKKTMPKVQVGLLKRKKTTKAKVPREITEARPKFEERLKAKPDWQQEDTLTANYQKNKLVMDPNEGFGRNNKGPEQALKSPESRLAAGEETYEDDDELRAACNVPRKTGEAPPQRLTSHQRQVVEKLIAAHGDDTKAMMLDRKLNPMQHSEGKLRMLLEAYTFWGADSKHDFRGPMKPYKKL